MRPAARNGRAQRESASASSWVEADRGFRALAEFLHDDELVVSLDDTLDIGDLVPRPHCEVGRDAAELLVLVLSQGDPLVALTRTALAKDRQPVLEIERLRKLLDPLVDLADQGLMPANLVCPLIHLVYRLRHRTSSRNLLIRGLVAYRQG